MKYFIGIFYILHGLVHLLYMGHALKYFELEKGFSWPDNSRLFGNMANLRAKRTIAGALCVIAAICFVAAGTLVLMDRPMQDQLALVSVLASTLLFIAFWDGSAKKLHTQGGIALLINILILIYTVA
jgi:hypothetical protein